MSSSSPQPLRTERFSFDSRMGLTEGTDLRGFVIEGTVAEITYDDDYLVATFTLNDGHTISIEYHDHYSAARQHPIEAGKQYKLYGFSKGVDESGMLRMYIWFVSD